MDTSVVIRAAGERTLELCRKIVERQVLPERVFVVQAAPFEEALRQTYQKGIELGAKWTLTVDADILLRPGAVEDMVAQGERFKAKTFQVLGQVYDKLLVEAREGGARLYRTSALNEALDLIPPDGQEKRPEFHATKCMMERGWRCERVRLVTGLHDYEQYYRDVYRKAVVHGHKWIDELGDLVLKWKPRAMDDPDYLVALRGVCAGLIGNERPRLDIRAFEGVDCGLGDLGLSEKQPLEASNGKVAEFERIVQAILDKECPWKTKPSSRTRQFVNAVKRRGLPSSLSAGMGALAITVGKRCRAAAERLDKQRTDGQSEGKREREERR